MPLSWVDIIMPLVILRCALTGKKSGLIVESFKLAGIFFATFITLHYYNALGSLLHQNLSLHEPIKDAYAFGLLAVGVHLLFSLIREGWLTILDIDVPPFINQWGGLILSALRAYLVCGLILLGLVVVKDKSIQASAKHSLSAFVFKDTSTGIYRSFYSGWVGKFFPKEPLNEEVFKLMDEEEAK